MRIKSNVKSQKSNETNGRVKVIPTIVFLLFSFFFSLTANAQCAMCRAAIESEGNATKAEAVNDGIVYLMIIPYVLVGIIGFAIYKMRQKKAI